MFHSQAWYEGSKAAYLRNCRDTNEPLDKCSASLPGVAMTTSTLLEAGKEVFPRSVASFSTRESPVGIATT